MFRLISLLSIVTLLTACAKPLPERIYIKEYEYIEFDIPEELFSPCRGIKPISPDVYEDYDMGEREIYLTNYSIRLLGRIKACDNQVRLIKKHVNDSSRIIREIESNVGVEETTEGRKELRKEN